MRSPSRNRSAERRPGARQHDAQRPDDVRRHAQQDLALGKRLVHQTDGAMFEVAQAAMDQLGGGRGGAGGEVVLLDQQHAQAAAGGIARQPYTVDAAADDREVVVGHSLLICLGPGRMGGLSGGLKNRAPERRIRPQNSAAIAELPRFDHIKDVRYACVPRVQPGT